MNRTSANTQVEAGVLNELEALFNQFFSASSTNEQKLEISEYSGCRSLPLASHSHLRHCSY